MRKVDVRESTIAGKGVFAAVPISRSEVILKLDDSRLVTAENPVDPKLGENTDHCDYLPDGSTVLMQSPERYINHSCSPNVYVFSINRERFLLPIRDISVDEELVFDYSLNAIGGDVWTCDCGLPSCRREHKCDYFHLPLENQIAYLPYVDPWFIEHHRDKFSSLLNRLSPA